MLHYICEVILKLLRVDKPLISHIHKPKRKLVPLVLSPIAQHVHDVSELFEY